ncbi:MAG: Gfo/Idh/MocA family oxidoreductase [Chloroflexi bacterium]|nr:Gfo/Idh/MocA family oxidoreductase [Chloroflexota bacterium]
MPVRIGAIGCGYWGPNLIRNFAEISEAELVAVADLREDRLAYIQARYPGVRTTKNYQVLFGMGLDAVVVATPPPTHYPIARDCLRHGLHTLVEKPLTLSSAHAEDLIRIADEQGLVLMVGHVFEFNPAVHALKSIIDSGELGEIYYISTERLNLGAFNPSLDVLWDLAPHDISILRYLVGADPIQTSASGASFILPGVTEIAFLCMSWPNNVYSHSRLSWLDPRKVREVTVVGSKKMAVYDDVSLDEKIRIYDKGVDQPYTDNFGVFQLQYHHGSVVIPPVTPREPLRAECEHFLHCIKTGEAARTDGRNGLAVVRVLEAAEASMRHGNRLRPIGMTEDEDTLERA